MEIRFTFKTSVKTGIGDSIWTKTYINKDFINGSWIEQTIDGGYIITGNKKITTPNSDLYLFKIDENGNEEWESAFGGSNYDYGLCVKQTYDNGFIVSGSNKSFGAGGEDVYLIKTNNNKYKYSYNKNC